MASNQVAKQTGWRSVLTRYESEAKALIPKHIDFAQLVSVAANAIKRNDSLVNCSEASVVNAILAVGMKGLSLDPMLGEAYLVPFKKHCTPIVGYKGLIKLAKQSGDIAKIDARGVRSGDAFSYQFGTDEHLHHKPAGVDGPYVSYYAIAVTGSGEHVFHVMSRGEVEAHRNRFSKSYSKGDSPWKTDFDAMALKTVVRQLLKFAVLSPEVQSAVTMDEVSESGSQIPTVIDIEPTAPELPGETQPKGGGFGPSNNEARPHDEAKPANAEAKEELTGDDGELF